jgi:hypothetical protein
MKLSSEMKNLSEEIITSFKQRVKENEELVIEVQETLNGFQKGHQEMAAALRGSLAKDEKNRLSEFKALMGSIINEISEIFTSTQTLLTKFDKEHQEMAGALRSGLDKGEEVRMNEFVALMKSINEDISEIFSYTHALLEKSETERLQEFAILIKSISAEVLRIFSYTHDMIAKFDKEHMEMSVELRKNLTDGEVDRLKEFNVLMTGIRNDLKNLKKAVAELLGDFAQEREGTSAAWKKLTDIMAQLRKTGVVAPTKEVIKKEAKKEVSAEKVTEDAPVKAETKPEVAVTIEAKNEIPAEKVMEAAPVKAEPKPVVPMTLEEKIVDFINKHPKGVKISEMEKPFGETRMKLGFIAKSLLDSGKVQKIDNVYFKVK